MHLNEIELAALVFNLHPSLDHFLYILLKLHLEIMSIITKYDFFFFFN